MKNISRLVALLLALMLCLTAAFAMAEETDEGVTLLEGSSDSYIGTELNANVNTYNQMAQSAATVALTNELMEAQSVEEMYALVLEIVNGGDSARFDTLMALSFDQLEQLRNRVYELDPELDDIDTQDMLDMLSALPNAICPDCGLTGEHAEDCPRGQVMILPTSGTVGATTITSNQDWNLTGDITLTGTITIKSGVKFRIRNDAAQKTVKVMRDNSFTGTMFTVEEGGSFQINGHEWNSGNWDAGNPAAGPVVIDGNSAYTATGNIIHCSGKLALRDTVIRNNKGQTAIYLNGNGAGDRYDTAHNKDVTVEITRTLIEKSNAKYGGGIFINGNTPADYSVDIWYSKIYQCSAVDASAIYFGGAGQATVTMRHSVVDDCDTTTGSTGEYGGALRTNGNGRFKFTMTDSVLRNCDSWKFGGGIYWNAAGTGSELKVEDCQFLNNTAAEMGGGMFLEGSDMTITATEGTPSAVYTSGLPGNLTGTLIQGNSAPNGGGISYKCYSNSAEVQVPTTVANFNENVIFNGNTGTNGAALAYNLHDTNNYPTGATFTFNINGAEFTGNTSSEAGGAIYIEKCREDYVCTVNFNSGSITENTAKNGGAVAITTRGTVATGGTFNMNGGNLLNNTAREKGGALYLQNGNFNMNSGCAEENNAQYGGTSYVSGGNITMTGGTMANNAATNDGGATYITGGDFTMTNGSITDNSATQNGGAVYMAGGNFTMEHGEVNFNNAVNGGAVYMAGTTSIFIMESGTMNSNTASNDGGAIYANGGTLKIGLDGCSGADDDQTKHTAKGDGRHHPVMQSNEAAQRGGGIAIADEGVVHFYCGSATGNEALYKGVGKNVFMDGGNFYLYDGANVGVPRDPDLVIVGGKLHDECDEKEYVHLYYYKKNTDDITSMQGLARYEEVMNLPDGEHFWKADDGMTFIGWTAQGAATNNVSYEFVRNKEQYVASGEPVQILDHKTTETDQTGINTNKLFDGATGEGEGNKKIMHLYALWAPIENKITYVSNLTNDVIENEAAHYENTKTGFAATINAPTADGYILAGWYIYQDEKQNANWGYEPKYKTGTTGKTYADLNLEEMRYIPLETLGTAYTLNVPAMTFGDITMVANFIPAYTDLTITKQGVTDVQNELDNPTFIFHVVGDADRGEAYDVVMDVVIDGNDSVTIKELPVGSYTITEVESWSWRYSATDAEQEVSLTDPKDPKTVTFTNTRDKTLWLDGEDYKPNKFN